MKVVHCKKEPFTVYIGRPSIFGNPFVVGTHGTQEQVVILYKRYLITNPHLLKRVKELKPDDILACWCTPKDCHGNAIIEVWEWLTGLNNTVIEHYRTNLEVIRKEENALHRTNAANRTNRQVC